jgi:hypothetical protein
MTYACPAWESAAVSHLMKLQRLQNKVLRVIVGLPRPTPRRDIHAELHVPYEYDFITKMCRKRAEVILNHENNVRSIGNGEARHRKHKRLKLGGGQAYDRFNVYTAEAWLLHIRRPGSNTRNYNLKQKIYY